MMGEVLDLQQYLEDHGLMLVSEGLVDALRDFLLEEAVFTAP